MRTRNSLVSTGLSRQIAVRADMGLPNDECESPARLSTQHFLIDDTLRHSHKGVFQVGRLGSEGQDLDTAADERSQELPFTVRLPDITELKPGVADAFDIRTRIRWRHQVIGVQAFDLS